MSDNKVIISAYGSHNAAIAMHYKNEYKVIEVERWLNIKNAGLSFYLPAKNSNIVFNEILEYLLSFTDKKEVDILLTDYVGRVTPKYPVRKQLSYDHHTAHAAAAFFQSPYQKSLTFSFDGGGDGKFFCVFLCDRYHGIKLIDSYSQDLGFPYMVICDYLEDIKKEALSIGNLVWAGKVMGLCSYGNVREEWIPHFDKFYDTFNYSGNSYIGGGEARYDALTKLFSGLGLTDFNFETSRYSGQIAYDIAATSQLAFERQFFKYAQKYLDEYPDLPVCMSGGCALNVLLNTKLLRMRNNKVFIPPNTNDCGIAVGGLLWYMQPQHQVDLTYSGLPVLDENNFAQYIQEHDLNVIENVTNDNLAKYIAAGFLVGILNGNSEHGSRALGNRSILCNPIEGMKEKLNEKVKHREWYRPFAPLVKLENAPKYFEIDSDVESRHMVLAVPVREEWRSKVPAVTHKDNTGRLQTVTEQQNKFIYDLLSNFEKHAGHGVLLNTSFNVNGKPILTRLSDALEILRHTELDAVYFKNNLIFRNDGSDKKFKNLIYGDTVSETVLSDDTTIYLISFPENEQRQKEHLKYIEVISKKNKVVVVTNEDNGPSYQINANDNVKFYFAQKRKLYYDYLVKKRVPDINYTVNDFSKYIKMLWCKEALTENLFRTEFQIFVNLDEYTDDPSDLDKLLELYKKFIKSEPFLAISPTKEKSLIFPDEEIENRYHRIVDEYPSGIIFFGNNQMVSWFLQNYEGVFLWYMNQNKVGKISDYLLISYLENTSKYKLL